MLILSDNNVPAPLRKHITDCTVDTAAEMGWAGIKNGDLLNQAVQAQYDIYLTCDQGIPDQQNLSNYDIRIVVLSRQNWPQKRYDESYIELVNLKIAKARKGLLTVV